MKKKFIDLGMSGCALAAWVLKSLLGGVLYATGAFLARLFLGRLGPRD